MSPFPDYDDERARRWLAAARDACIGAWPEPRRTHVEVNATVPAVDAPTARALAASSRCRTVKVKVGEGDDVARVDAVRAALGPSGRIRVDANGVWDVDTAVKRIKALAHFDLEYVEQPVATLAGMAAVRARVEVPLAVDESIRTAPDPLRTDVAGAADVVVLKVHPLGGVGAALRVAEACGLPVVVSSALETSIGMSAGVALAAALPELPYACGLGTVGLLVGDVVARPLVPVEGMLEVRRAAVDEAALRRHEVTPARGSALERWFEMARADGARE